MFKKLDEVKVLRDPVHGYIHIEYQVIWDCLNSKEFQRLRRIKQLGASYMVYHTAEHTRFAHSLGVYEIVRRMCEEVNDIGDTLSEKEKVTVMLAGLLHDIGHGPFSHAFENICPTPHEEFSIRIILEDTQVHRAIEKACKGLSKDVAAVIDHTHKNTLLSQMVSGQLDADRMDYLLRDAYFTGTKYGEFDLERILRTLRVKNDLLLITESGMHTVEDYIMARYHMYWQVYYHPVARSYECILSSLFIRLKDMYKENPKALDKVEMFKPFLNNKKVSLDDHFMMDEATCFYGFEMLIDGPDKIASDLAHRLRDRELFEYQNIDSKKTVKEVADKLKQHGYDTRYYLYQDEVKQRPYLPYSGLDERSILVLMHDGSICELSKASVIVSSLTQGKNKNDNKVFYPTMD